MLQTVLDPVVSGVAAAAAHSVTVPVSTLAVLILLAPLVLVWLLVEVRSKVSAQKASDKVLSFLRCTTILAAVLFYCYFCEHIWPIEKAKKIERPAMYWGTFGVLVLVAILSVRKSKDEDEFLGRDQTEEWKGWMQFLFIQYHYWHQETAYQDIRVYITCYLWMTGFGNFAFFYMKNDFTLLRVLQMLWRMNFFVFFLCLTMNNPYIVYYICPLHTFFFLFTYATMAFWSEVNHRQYHPMIKCAVMAVLLYIVYDALPQIFHPVFGWLGTESTHAPIGGHGVEWEWYFRSFLDHFSTMWGMVFALNMPFLSAWFKKVESFSPAREWGIKICMLAVMGVAMAFWVRLVYLREKGSYNAVHCYYAIVPLLSYLLVRNICPLFRKYYFFAMHWFGQYTLESYLLQYHIWLAANAGMLLNIFPGSWFLTFVVASVIHVFCATRVFNITNTLRSLVLPNDTGVALRNLMVVMTFVVASFGFAIAFVRTGAVWLHLIWIVLGIAAAELGMLRSITSAAEESEADEKVSLLAQVRRSNLMQAGGTVAFMGLLVAIHFMLGFGRGEKANVVHLNLIEWFTSATSNVSLGTDMFDLRESHHLGRLMGFAVGSLAQRWHGLVVLGAMILCIVAADPFFGLCRLFMFIWAPEGQKTISWEEAYGPLLQKIGKAPPALQQPAQRAEEGNVGEKTPLLEQK